MNALDRNRYTEAWRAFGACVPRPRAILAIPAHWYIHATAVTPVAQPRTIHHFSGFPRALFDVQYPAPGAPELADEVAQAVHPVHLGRDPDSWGIDHGTWSVLVHAFPRADVPVAQLSINAAQPFEYHFELGAKLAPLRNRGVLILASGNVVHNLRRMERHRPDAAFDWNRRFDEATRALMTHAPADALKLREHPDFALAAPTPDHFLPLLYLAGLAAAASKPAEVLVQGYAMGSISMTAYTLGTECEARTDTARGAPPLGEVPGDQTNI